MERFDSGFPGKTFEAVKWTFMPRLFYPDKPIVTTGVKFTELAIGGALVLVVQHQALLLRDTGIMVG